MKIKNFEQFLNEFEVSEMALPSGNLDKDSYSKEQEWNSKTDLSKNIFIKLLLDKMGGSRFKIYLEGTSSYYLTDENNSYLGQIEGDRTGNSLYIRTSHANSNKIKGFYSYIFPMLFSIGIEKIYSNNSLSNKAINSYIRLSNTTNMIKIQTYNVKTNEYRDWDSESQNILTSDISIIICVTEKHKGDITEHFNNYYYEINGPMKLFYDRREVALDNRLLGRINDPIYEEII